MTCPTVTGDHAGRPTDYTPVVFSEVAPTLDTAYACKQGLDNQHINGGCGLFVKTSVAFEPRFVRTTGGQPSRELTPCLRADTNTGDGAPCVAIADVIHGDKSCNGKGWNDDGSAYTLDTMATQGLMQASCVRRITPIETERLMGFPRIVSGDVSAMTKDEYIVWLLATHRIEVNCEAGEVFSMRTGGGIPCLPRRLNGTVLNGYRVVSLREGDVKKQCRVHRIVWIAKHGLVPDGHVVDHINNDKLDNRIENLQLLTPADNSTKAAEDGLYRTGDDNPSTKLTDKEVEWIFDDYWSSRGSIRELAERAGVSKSRVHQIIHMDDWTRIPWRNKPAEQCPDGPRYKACGNSMGVNVMRWIGTRIQEVEEQK